MNDGTNCIFMFVGGELLEKKEMLQHIKDIKFSFDASPILNILEEHLDKVEFVKDFADVRDFIFLAEEVAYEDEYPFYACFDFDPDSNDNGIYDVYYDVTEICANLKKFFKVFHRPIYISIGFANSLLTSEDILYIHHMLEAGEIQTKSEGESKLRKFPTWYDAKYPFEMSKDIELRELIEKIKIREEKLTLALKAKVLQDIDKALEEENKEEFLRLTAQLNRMMTKDDTNE